MKVEAYYENELHRYWVNHPSGWINVSEDGLTRYLRHAGMSKRATAGMETSQIDREIIKIQQEQRIDFAGPLAGWKKGVYDSFGYKTLVTHSPRLLTPKEGDWKIVESIFEGLYREGHPDQVPTIYSWYQVALQNLYEKPPGKFVPGQMKFVFGGRNTGKSFEQTNITTPVFGGRSAEPFRYMSGETTFNRDLLGCEHLQIEDPAINGIKDKQDFANRIKQFTVNETQSCHGKNREAFSQHPMWRVTVTGNSELHNVGIITATDASVLDKIMIFKASDVCAAPSEAYKHLGRIEFLNAVTAALPAFVYFLLHQWKIPEHLRDRRFGVKAFLHEELLAQAQSLTNEQKLMEVLEEGRFFENGPWEGTLLQLSRRLACLSDMHEAVKFSKNQNSLRHTLCKLQSQHPEWVKQKRTTAARSWVINKPKSVNN